MEEYESRSSERVCLVLDDTVFLGVGSAEDVFRFDVFFGSDEDEDEVVVGSESVFTFVTRFFLGTMISAEDGSAEDGSAEDVFRFDVFFGSDEDEVVIGSDSVFTFVTRFFLGTMISVEDGSDIFVFSFLGSLLSLIPKHGVLLTQRFADASNALGQLGALVIVHLIGSDRLSEVAKDPTKVDQCTIQLLAYLVLLVERYALLEKRLDGETVLEDAVLTSFPFVKQMIF